MTDIDWTQFQRGDLVKITFNGERVEGEITVMLTAGGDYYDVWLEYVSAVGRGNRCDKADIASIEKVAPPIIEGDVVWFEPDERYVSNWPDGINGPGEMSFIVIKGDVVWGSEDLRVIPIEDIPDDAIWLVRGGELVQR